MAELEEWAFDRQEEGEAGTVDQQFDEENRRN
jgi:hypothetical protein